ncbi:NAD(P)-dependent oxidoreductase [Planctomonas sp. JC2975]|uniref:NAD-dependent epimerase/dehydratase family protein n=1 Tax=Planctomonas sp. JC2975 TaxID=2729626 RepID=UPI0014746977|nr:NAD(P)-dependent oxidoreductase [Planctomonas sp. JC2975]NNC13927.1 NAD(P)-dependent oxidoreductase [Planctomonas sp. JC2975]
MRIALTGGSGKLGRTAVRVLREAGHDVTNFDVAGSRGPGFLQVDLKDYGQVVDALAGVRDGARQPGYDAIVHLGAIPAPGIRSDVATFENNILSTYHVFQAARTLGIRNIVYASSETVLGLPFDIDPPYLPIDEEYPGRPESTYSLVKHLEETMAKQFIRWDPQLKIIGLRFSNVMDPDDYAAFPGYDVDTSNRRWNAFGYIDARDGGQAILKAVESDLTGFEAFIIAAADTVSDRTNAELAAAEFPNVEIARELGEHDTMLSVDKARRLLGYDPQHSWRDHV